MTDFEKDVNNKVLSNNQYIVVLKLKGNYLFLTDYYVTKESYISNLEFSTESDPKKLDENEIRSVRGFLNTRGYYNENDIKILKLSYLEVEDD